MATPGVRPVDPYQQLAELVVQGLRPEIPQPKKRKPGRPPWEPTGSQIEAAAESYGPGLASLEDIAIDDFKIAPSTLFKYLAEHPFSVLSEALTRARAVRRKRLKAKATSIAIDDEHPGQAKMLTFLLARFGGKEFHDRVEVTGPGGAPLMGKPTSIKLSKAAQAAVAKALAEAVSRRK